jgi:hypothetical protein
MFFKRNNIRSSTILYQGKEIEVSFKRIKNIYLKVSPSRQSIRISAPVNATIRELESFLAVKWKWVEKQLAKTVKKPEPPLALTQGEQIPWFGEMLTLRLIIATARPKVELTSSELVMRIKPETTLDQKKKLLDNAYRNALKLYADDAIKRWAPKMGVNVHEFGVKKMKTRWGTCNIRAKRIWLNLHLAKYSPDIIEMVVVHELVHLLERLHNKRFYAFMDHFLPDWKERSERLDGQIC